MNESEFGGTKLQRKPPQQMQQPSQQMQQQQPSQQMQPTQQQMQQMQQMQQQQMQMPPQQMQQQQMPFIKSSKESFSKIDSKSMKYAILVVLIFIILNSKIIWKQILKLPMMGSMEPGIIALIVNSILAGVIFYVVTTILIK